jgi:hypothetical protein
MKFNEIQKMAKGRGINTFQMNKTSMIRAIQRTENNMECYGTPRVNDCGESACLWRDDCLSVDKTAGQA